MTANTMTEFIGKIATLYVGGMNVKVVINDCRERYGFSDYAGRRVWGKMGARNICQVFLKYN